MRATDDLIGQVGQDLNDRIVAIGLKVDGGDASPDAIQAILADVESEIARRISIHNDNGIYIFKEAFIIPRHSNYHTVLSLFNV